MAISFTCVSVSRFLRLVLVAILGTYKEKVAGRVESGSRYCHRVGSFALHTPRRWAYPKPLCGLSQPRPIGARQFKHSAASILQLGRAIIIFHILRGARDGSVQAVLREVAALDQVAQH